MSLLDLHLSYWYPNVIVGVAKIIGSLVIIERAMPLKIKFMDARFIINVDIT